MSNPVSVLLFATENGRALGSKRPLACCEILRKPLLTWMLDACRALSPASLSVAAGGQEGLPLSCEAAAMAELVPSSLAALAGEGSDLLALDAAYPFLTTETLLAALSAHRQAGRAITLLTAEANPDGPIAGCWIAPAALLSYSTDAPLSGVADLVGRLSGTSGAFFCPGAALDRPAGRKALAGLNQTARAQVFERLWAEGVDLPLTDGVLIGPDVTIGPDTTVLPGCQLLGRTTIGSGCVIGPNTTIVDCVVGDDTVIDSCRLAESRVGAGVRLGPFSQLRPNSVLADGVKVGNFVEIKNSTVGKKTSLAHLTYIGDSDFGERINVGCGVVTVNYDGKRKFRTTVKDNAFIGCNTNLVAPVTVGEGAYVAAASTVTEDVEPDALAIGRVRVVQKSGWASARRQP